MTEMFYHIHLANICGSQIFSPNLWQVMDRKWVSDSWVQDFKANKPWQARTVNQTLIKVY